jgi:hypothetical protein
MTVFAFTKVVLVGSMIRAPPCAYVAKNPYNVAVEILREVQLEQYIP